MIKFLLSSFNFINYSDLLFDQLLNIALAINNPNIYTNGSLVTDPYRMDY